MISFLLAFALNLQPAATGIQPAFPFTSDAVFQRDRPIPVWGTATTDGAVRVTFGDVSIDTVVSNGVWSVTFPPMKAGGPYRLVIEGGSRVELTDILIGEVWVASGQSNMEWPMSGVLDATDEIRKMRNPDIRYLHAPRAIAATPQPTASSEGWHRLTSNTAPEMSAVAWYFASMLQDSLDVPVGIIQSSWGGTRIESWIPSSHILSDPDYARMAARADQPQHIPATLYNAMIHPFTRLPVQGVIWYQGESNTVRAVQYRRLFRTMIHAWRESWNDPALDVLYVQLANFGPKQVNPVENQHWPELREAQLMALSLPHTGMAVAADVGDADDIHPRDKKRVGHRLARIALHQTYARPFGTRNGPEYAGFEVMNGEVVIRFRETGRGLTLKDAPKSGFAVAGEDRVFFWAQARVVGQTVVLSSPSVPVPVAVRYGWADNPHLTLYNDEGLPASPFRSDPWYLVTEANR